MVELRLSHGTVLERSVVPAGRGVRAPWVPAGVSRVAGRLCVAVDPQCPVLSGTDPHSVHCLRAPSDPSTR